MEKHIYLPHNHSQGMEIILSPDGLSDVLPPFYPQPASSRPTATISSCLKSL